MSVIRIFTVGGTIDKFYFDAKSRYEVGPPNISKILEELSLNPEFEVTSLMQKDSLDMTKQDRELILKSVVQATQQRMVITHGTDTMVATANKLSEVAGKTIVLTGALVSALYIFKSKGSVVFTGKYVHVISSAVAMTYGFLDGGFNSQAIIWLCILPVFLMFFSAPLSGKILIGTVILYFVFLCLAHVYGIVPSSTLTGDYYMVAEFTSSVMQ